MAASVTCGQIMAFAPKLPPTNSRDDADLRERDREQVSDRELAGPDAHRRVVHRQPVAVPARRRRRRLERVVVVRRHVVRGVDDDLGGGQRRVDVAAFVARRHQAAEQHLRLVGGVSTLVDRRDRAARLVHDVDQRGGVLRSLVAVGDDDRDRLAVVVHEVVLQREEALARCRAPGEGRQEARLAGDRGQVLVREHREHAVGRECVGGIDRRDPPAREARADDGPVGEARQGDLARVAGVPRGLVVPVERETGRPIAVVMPHLGSSRWTVLARSRARPARP